MAVSTAPISTNYFGMTIESPDYNYSYLGGPSRHGQRSRLVYRAVGMCGLRAMVRSLISIGPISILRLACIIGRR